MLKCLLFFLLGILTFVILFFTSWWLIMILVLWTLILFRLVQSTVKLKELTDHTDKSPFISNPLLASHERLTPIDGVENKFQ